LEGVEEWGNKLKNYMGGWVIPGQPLSGLRASSAKKKGFPLTGVLGGKVADMEWGWCCAGFVGCSNKYEYFPDGGGRFRGGGGASSRKVVRRVC